MAAKRRSSEAKTGNMFNNKGTVQGKSKDITTSTAEIKESPANVVTEPEVETVEKAPTPTPIIPEPTPDEAVVTLPVPPMAKKIEAEPTEVKKIGRPKVKSSDSVRTTINISKELLEASEIALIKYKGNRSEYIEHLIAEDLERNKAKYDLLRETI